MWVLELGVDGRGGWRGRVGWRPAVARPREDPPTCPPRSQMLNVTSVFLSMMDFSMKLTPRVWM